MRIGICTRYGHRECTYAAIRMANELASTGMEVSIYAVHQTDQPIDNYWDSRVVDSRAVLFTRWAAHQQHMLWTTIPHREQLSWVMAKDIQTSVLVIWHDLSRDDLKTLRVFDHVLSPSRACHELLLRYGVTRSALLPWDCGQPFCRKPFTHVPANPKMLVPLWDGKIRRNEMTLFNILDRVVEDIPNAEITIACSSSTMDGLTFRRTGQLQRLAPERVRVIRRVRPSQRFQLFHDHDVTLDASNAESLCSTQLQSIELGTPVIGFEIAPVDEIFTIYNAVRIPVRPVNLPGLIPYSAPDYEVLDTQLRDTLNSPERLRSLQQTTAYSTFSRREAFRQTLLGIVR